MPRVSDASGPRNPATMRLQRYLARAGVASRRHSERLISQGRVAVNGVTITQTGSTVLPGIDRVEVDGKPVVLPTTQEYVVLNKPAGYVTTMDDPQGRPTVADLLPDVLGLVPCGRLDRDTTGVLLAMNDGDLVHRLLHPSHHVPKVYHVVVEGEIDEVALGRLAAGVELDDGPTQPAEASLVSTGDGRSRITITLREGRKRQVKRMCAAVGHPVVELHRSAFGPVTDADLPVGEHRSLTKDEVAQLRTAAGTEE